MRQLFVSILLSSWLGDGNAVQEFPNAFITISEESVVGISMYGA